MVIYINEVLLLKKKAEKYNNTAKEEFGKNNGEGKRKRFQNFFRLYPLPSNVSPVSKVRWQEDVAPVRKRGCFY
jgi:hypothetical protein